ncbi:hypothetical protein GCK32_013154 [Trichostrongylus colubriformis]|uniref:Uncharacterized protein n=1 Tax=Trichostrongylus colubriformis TaxID=6319 RepID=A0AAN8I9J2_TRICO
MRWFILACLIVVSSVQVQARLRRYYSNNYLSRGSLQQNTKCHTYPNSNSLTCLYSYKLPSNCMSYGRDTVTCTIQIRNNDFSTLSRKRARFRLPKIPRVPKPPKGRPRFPRVPKPPKGGRRPPQGGGRNPPKGGGRNPPKRGGKKKPGVKPPKPPRGPTTPENTGTSETTLTFNPTINLNIGTPQAPVQQPADEQQQQ